MKTIFKIIIMSFSIFVAAWILPNVEITNYPTAILAAIVVSLLNVFIKPILIFLTIPITIFTFGIFLLFINAIIFIIAAWLLNGFEIGGLFSAFILSILVSIINFILSLTGRKKHYNNQQNNNSDDSNNYIQI